MNIASVSDLDDRAFHALIESQTVGGYVLPDPVLEAVVGVETADDRRSALAAIERTVSEPARAALETSIRARVHAAAGAGETIEDPLEPVRAAAARDVALRAEIALVDAVHRNWSQALRARILDYADVISDAIAAALEATLDEAAPIAAALAAINFGDPEALHKAPKAVVAQFAQAGPLAERHDAARKAGWALSELVRPRGGGGSSTAYAEWSTIAYRFAGPGSGIELTEAEQFFRDDDSGDLRRWAKLGAARYAPKGHPVHRLVQAAAGAAAVATR
jgi:hypothetical protein